MNFDLGNIIGPGVLEKTSSMAMATDCPFATIPHTVCCLKPAHVANGQPKVVLIFEINIPRTIKKYWRIKKPQI
jgi:hypothetical protein